MAPYKMEALTQELFLVLGQVSRFKWEKSPLPGLKASECELLGILYLNLGNGAKTIAASELSNQLNITPAAITHLLNPLEDAGYISRDKDPADRRFVLISLSKDGKQVAESLVREAQEILKGLVDFLGEKDSSKLALLLSKLLKYFSELPLENGTI